MTDGPDALDSNEGLRLGPVRTCVGCRARAPKSELLRVVAVAGDAVIDVQRRLPGRGAHLHPDPGCLTLALRRKALPRALRHRGELDCTALIDQVHEHQVGAAGSRLTIEGG